jgi:hypothetical protein
MKYELCEVDNFWDHSFPGHPLFMALRLVQCISNQSHVKLSQLLSLQGTIGQVKPGSYGQVQTRGLKSLGAYPARHVQDISKHFSHAAAWALVRVAATEIPQIKWSVLDSDLTSSTQTRIAADSTNADSFGLALLGGIFSGPRLLGAEPPAPNTGRIRTDQGQVFIIGGLGGIVKFHPSEAPAPLISLEPQST